MLKTTTENLLLVIKPLKFVIQKCPLRQTENIPLVIKSEIGSMVSKSLMFFFPFFTSKF